MSSKQPYTFKIKSPLNEEVAYNLLIKRGWVPSNSTAIIHDLLHIDYIEIIYTSEKERYAALRTMKVDVYQQSIIKNRLDGVTRLGDKVALYTRLIKHNKDRRLSYMTKAYNVKSSKDLKRLKSKLFKTHQYYIIKSSSGVAGLDILSVDNWKDLQKFTSTLLNKKMQVNISEYIDKPLLWNKKKFHLRLYFFSYVKTIDSDYQFETYLMDMGYIFTAKDDFQLGDLSNKEIHDSHLESTPKEWLFPRDFKKKFNVTQTKKVQRQIIKILYDVSSAFDGIIKSYSESKCGYHLHGTDFMIDENFNVFLLEFNTRTGLKAPRTKASQTRFTKKMFESIMLTFVDPILKPDKPSRCKSSFIKIYP
jgi:hypothetical protein